MNRNNTAGILAFLGAAAGAFAWWKYNNLSASDKQKLKNKITDVGDKVVDGVKDFQKSASKTISRTSNEIEASYQDLEHDLAKKN